VWLQSNAFAGELASVSTLTLHAWKFYYTFMPLNKQIVNEGTNENFIYLKFEKDKSFTLISKDKVEKGNWTFEDREGINTVVFGFKGIDTWLINYLNEQTFVIHCENENGLLEYHFSPATNEKDLNLMALRINQHIDEMQDLLKQMTYLPDNTRVDNINIPNEKIIKKSSGTYTPVNVFDKIKNLDAKDSQEISLTNDNKQLQHISEADAYKEDILKLKSLNGSKTPQTIVTAESTPIQKELANTNNIRSSQRVPTSLSKKEFIKIYISGGGLKAGVNPKIKDIVTIDNSGFVKKDYESLLGGKYTYSKKVSKDDIIKLAEYIINKGFFDFPEEYVCIEGCEKLETLSGPKPIPLKIIVEVGAERHTVFVPIYAPEMEGYKSNYPKELTDIVDAIHDIADI
jgi:hypothetical protein